MFYVLDDNNNKIEALDKEGVLAALEEAIANGSLESLVADSAFVTKLKCCITGGTTKMAFVTSAQYNELEAGGAIEKGVAYFIIDDTTIDDIDVVVKNLNDTINGIETTVSLLSNKLLKIEKGTTVVPKAVEAEELKSVVIYTSTDLSGKEKGATIVGTLEDGYRYIVGVTDGLAAQWIATGVAQRGTLNAEFIQSASSFSNGSIGRTIISLSNSDSGISYDDCVYWYQTGSTTAISGEAWVINKIVRLEKVF